MMLDEPCLLLSMGVFWKGLIGLCDSSGCLFDAVKEVGSSNIGAIVTRWGELVGVGAWLI